MLIKFVKIIKKKTNKILCKVFRHSVVRNYQLKFYVFTSETQEFNELISNKKNSSQQKKNKIFN